jgi:hypothetical protein
MKKCLKLQEVCFVKLAVSKFRQQNFSSAPSRFLNSLNSLGFYNPRFSTAGPVSEKFSYKTD